MAIVLLVNVEVISLDQDVKHVWFFFSFFFSWTSFNRKKKNNNLTANPCSSRPCVNGGTCVQTSNSNNFECRCPAAYFGDYCQNSIISFFSLFFSFYFFKKNKKSNNSKNINHVHQPLVQMEEPVFLMEVVSLVDVKVVLVDQDVKIVSPFSFSFFFFFVLFSFFHF